ncbi:MAG: nucleotidyltransferase domain-containing protein [bacterium]|nr:nucleotidyltransferase domain-containing protein [bacterium]
MSRIFPYAAAAKGAVPRTSDFLATVEKMKKFFASPAFEGALLFGSVLRNDHGPTSDIDCVVVYDWKLRSTAFAFMSQLTESAWERNVPLQLIPFDGEMARQGFHTIGDDIGHHLRWAAANGGVLKGDPLSHFSFHSSVENVRGYIAGKLSSVQKGWVRCPIMSPDEKLRFFGKALDVPTYLARKVLWAKGHHLDVDSKEQVSRKYAECFPALYGLLLGVIATKRAYEELVRSFSGRRVTEEQYRSWLVVTRERIIPQVLDFLRGNAELLGPMLT